MLPRQRHPWPRRLWPARQEAAREVAPAAVVDRSGILRPSGPPFLARLATGEIPGFMEPTRPGLLTAPNTSATWRKPSYCWGKTI